MEKKTETPQKEKLAPLGHRLLIKPDEVETEKTESGIVLNSNTVEADKLAQVRGTVIGIGPTCFQGLSNKTRSYVKEGITYTEDDSPSWCEVGDKVYYQRHSGQRIPDKYGKFRDDLLLLNDQDITALVIGE